jgi:RNA polymerase sigma-70 factor (ECF subfamily)
MMTSGSRACVGTSWFGPHALAPSSVVGDQGLVACALADDRAALAELARRLAPVIRARIARVLRRRASAGQPRCALDDLTQEVFVRLLACDRRALRAWDPDRGLSLASFVGLIAEREASSVLDSQRRTPRSDGLELHGDVEELHGSLEPTSERQQIARDLLAKLYERLGPWLSPRGRELFQMLYVQQEPLDVVAKRFAMPPSAVYAWRSRVGKRARELLDELA